MHLNRFLGLAGVVIASAAILIATAGASRGPAAHRQLSFKTPAAFLKYLKTQGVDTRGFVVQRGKHNYAGPNCPGRRWHCSRAQHVVQFDEGGGDNKFQCSPSYGTPTNPPFTDTTAPPNTCVIVQVNSDGNNNATCTERSSLPGVSQKCDVYQENVSGKNRSQITQVIDQQGGQSQNGSQHAKLIQINKTGKNDSDLSQTIRQATNAPGPSVSQQQTGTQENTIDQEASSGAQNSTMSQSVNQLARAGDVEGRDHVILSAVPLGKSDGGSVTGSQSQFGNGSSDTVQSSSGVSKSDNDQSMKQRELAPENSTGLTQYQLGPWRCCSPQGTNPKDKFTLTQSKVQFASTLLPAGGERAKTFAACIECPSGQHLTETGNIRTSGTGSISQFADQNGTQSTNTCNVTNGACSADLSCAGGVCTTFSCSGACDAPVGFSMRATAYRQPSRVHQLRVNHLR